MTEHLALDTTPHRFKLRIEDYRLLDDAGAFADYAKTELIDGVVYQVSPQHRLHGYAKDELAYRLRRALEALDCGLHVATEQSVEIPPDSEPQPDIILTSEPRGSGAIPVSSVALIAEVAVSSADLDLGEKARLYALAGVPEYWVVLVNDRMVRQHWMCRADGYQHATDIPFGSVVSAHTVASLSVRTEGLS